MSVAALPGGMLGARSRLRPLPLSLVGWCASCNSNNNSSNNNNSNNNNNCNNNDSNNNSNENNSNDNNIITILITISITTVRRITEMITVLK